VKERETRISQLRNDAATLAEKAAETLNMGKEELRDTLANMQIIPPVRITPAEYARTMTPGDARALVQELVKLYPTDNSRGKVFAVLRATCNAIAEKIKSAQPESKPLAKTG
jgi:hypothetical protein